MICACGCGLPAAIAKRTNANRGVVKGQPCRFRAGHKSRSVNATDYRKVQTERGAVREHIVVAERALGRSLPLGVEVHHIDENKRNNANTNLVICENHAYHHLLHVRARVVRAGGNPNTDKVCSSCRRALPRTSFGNGSQRCMECGRAYQRERYAKTRGVAA